MQIEEKITEKPVVDSWRTTNSLCGFFVVIVVVVVILVVPFVGPL